MTKEEIEKLPNIIDMLLSESVLVDTKEKTHEKITEVCNLAIKALEQEPKPMVEIDLDYVIKQKYIEREVLDKIRAEIGNHCGLTKGKHCRYCSYCHSVMGVREILEIIDKYKGESEG